MRCELHVGIVLALIAAAGAFGQGDPKLFDYDASAALDYKENRVSSRDGVVVNDATFASPKGGRVLCYVVAPEGDRGGKRAGVVWQHGGGQNRQWFLPDAIELAKAGVVSILMEAPFNRPADMRAPKTGDEVQQSRDEMLQVAVDARRALDVLAARPDVDPARIGYVGLSFGAMMGASLAGIDKRFATFILIVGLEGFVRHYTESPVMASFRGQFKKEDFDALLAAFAPTDNINYIGKSTAPLLFQAARFDLGVPEKHTYDFFKAAGSPKELRWYDAGHNLNDRHSAADRIDWLKKYLKIK